MKKIKLVDIARAARVHAGTVSKILNNWPHDTFDEATRQRVLKIAKQLGYLHPQIVKSDRRDTPRKKIGLRASIKVYLNNGRIFSQFKARASDISTTGMLLKSISGKNKCLPLEPFYLDIILTGMGKRSRFKARPIRFHLFKASDFGLAVQFIEKPRDDEFIKLIGRFGKPR